MRAKSPRRWSLWSTLSMSALAVGGVYLVLLAVPYLAVGPTDDPQFGPLNVCLRRALTQGSLGFAVSPDGRWAASYTGTQVGVCTTGDAAPRVLPLSGVTSSAFDFSNQLWLGTSPREGEKNNLWRWTEKDEAPRPVHALVPLALVPHEKGVVALESSGLLMSFDAEGNVLSEAQVAGAWPTSALLSANVDGSMVFVLAHGGLRTFQSRTLSPVSAASPCRASHAFWTLDKTRVHVLCEPENVALEFTVTTGQFEPLPVFPKHGLPTLVPGLKKYLQSCDNLPCLVRETDLPQ